jgi:dihydrofolate synthase/folylpolyglutamate synthase
MGNLDEWLEYQTRVHPQAIDLGLDRLTQVLERLGWHQPSVPVITIAGTNGKGSVAAYTVAILSAAGYRVGCFTSPHLRDYRERIWLHDRPVSAQQLVGAFERIEAARGELGLTFFEYNTLAALLVFEAAKLDAWVLEVGMGGRLDAVNVVDPQVSVVVSIGLDHQEFLGSSLAAIAREKAGILRPGRPAVLGSRQLPAEIESYGRSIGAKLKRPGVEYDYERMANHWSYRGSRWSLANLPPPGLLGDTQYENAATAIAAIEELDSRLPVSCEAVKEGLVKVRLVGRFQVIKLEGATHPTWVLDVAHNPAAAGVLARNLRAQPTTGRTLAVCGILADKDALGIVGELVHDVDAWWFCSLEGARGMRGVELAARLAAHLRAPVQACESVSDACHAALTEALPGDRIVVFGSFHTVGPALDWLEAQGQAPPAALPEYTCACEI